MAALEEIVVSIDAKIDGLLKGMKDAEKATGKSTTAISKDLEKITGDFRSAANSAGNWAAATIAAAAAAAGAIVASTSTQVAALDRSAQRLGESVEVLSAFGQAAKAAGLDQEQFADVLQQINIQIQDFVQTGGGGAFDLITQLGIDARALNELKPSEQLLAIGDAIRGIPESAALKFLDDIGSDDLAALLPLIKDGGDLFRSMAQEAIDAGRVIRTQDVEAIRLMNVELRRAQAETAVLGTQFTTALSPFIVVAVEQFGELTEGGVEFLSIIDEGFKIASKVVGTFSDGLQGIEIIFKVLEIASTGFVAGVATGLGLFDDEMAAFAESATKQITDLSGELETLLAAPLSSDAVEQLGVDFLEKVRQIRADVAAEAASAGPIVIPLTPEIETGLDTLDTENVRFFSDERLKEAVIQLAVINREFEDSQQTQLAVLAERFERESAILQEANDRKKIDEEQFLADSLELNERFSEQKRMLALDDLGLLAEDRERELEAQRGFLEAKLITEEEFERRKSEINRQFSAQSIDLAQKEAVSKSFFGKKSTTDIIAGLNSLGEISEKAAKAAFRVNQAKAISDTVVSTASGIQRAFADLPFPAALAASAAIAASGVAQLASISSQSFGSGGGAPSAGTVGLPGADTAAAAPSTAADVELVPSLDVSVSTEEGPRSITFEADPGSFETLLAESINMLIERGSIRIKTQ